MPNSKRHRKYREAKRQRNSGESDPQSWKSGCKHGCDKQNWLEAERELLAEQARYGNSGLTYYR